MEAPLGSGTSSEIREQGVEALMSLSIRDRRNLAVSVLESLCIHVPQNLLQVCTTLGVFVSKTHKALFRQLRKQVVLELPEFLRSRIVVPKGSHGVERTPCHAKKSGEPT